MRLKYGLFRFVFIFQTLMVTFNVNGQTIGSVNAAFTIPTIALLDIEPSASTSLTFNLTTDPESGQPISAAGATDNSLWLNYSSSIPTGGLNHKVSVQVNGTIPSGISITLTAANYSGTGGVGTFGTTTGPVILSTTPQTLISGIGRSCTGDGQLKGHQLTYTIGISDYKSLYFNQSTTLQVAFTLADM